MPFYVTRGLLPPKRHVAFRSPEGALYHEELVGNYGFVGPSSRLYHLRPPTRVRSCERLGPAAFEEEPERSFRLRHLRTARLPASGSPILGRVPLLGNGDVTLSMAVPAEAEERLYRNGQADEVVLVVEGRGVLETQYGEIAYEPGDQLVVHRGILHRYRMGEGQSRFLVLESRGYVRTPKRYRNEHGQLLEGAPFCERDIKLPSELTPRDEPGEHELLVKQQDALHRVVLDHHPFDLVGWDGYYFPWAFNMRDFEPIVGKVHQPPPVHQVFEAEGFVVCDFCPRPYDFHPEAIPAPYNHSNVMSDEVLFYLGREFMSRRGVEGGSITLHPDGLPHGPHPGKYEESIGKAGTEEMAFMVDTFRPLRVSRKALAIEDTAYPTSWLE